MKCWFCGESLIWQNDYDFEDYGLNEEGIVTVLYCPKCDSIWEGYLKLEKDEDNGTNK
jgi:hypothetical protein